MPHLFIESGSAANTDSDSFDRNHAIHAVLRLFDELGQPKVPQAFDGLSDTQLAKLIVELRDALSEMQPEPEDREALRSEGVAANEEQADWITNGHTRMPNWMIVNTGVSALARFLYQCLALHAWQKDWCIVGQATLARYLGVSDRTVRNLLKELVAAGWIEIKRRGRQKPNRYNLKHTIKTKKRSFDQRKQRQ